MSVRQPALTELTIAELAAGFAARELSPVEVTDAYLTRIEEHNAALHAYVLVTAERARADALAAEAAFGRGEVHGPLQGVPIALKDLYETAGIPTTGNSRAYLDYVPRADGAVVGKLAEAGAIFLGKLVMHELATGAPDLDGPFPPARNPWDLDRMPSGSSSGSASALAARLCAGSLGSDTGGSIRGPASWCNIVGLKPTYGLCSRRGVMPLSWSLDHVGPMARTVEDAAMLLQAIAGFDPQDDGSVDVAVPDYRAGLADLPRGLRVGVPWSYLESRADLGVEVLPTFRTAITALEGLGMTVVPIELPLVDLVEAIGNGILVSEAYTIHERGLRENPDRYGWPFASRVLRGATMSAADYLHATRGRGRFCRAMAEVMRGVDLIATPTSPAPAELFDDPTGVYYSRPSFTRLFNVTGQPSISVPSGFTAHGLPLGLMLSGRPFADRVVLQAAHAYEQIDRLYLRMPPGF
ncbi:MAG: amidase [Chloroflexi bacterium]|nr:amidase [Chloroflexota bacterium]